MKMVVVPLHAMKGHRVGRGKALLALAIGTKWRQVVNFHAPATLPLGKNQNIH
jgi:hypothetical protein